MNTYLVRVEQFLVFVEDDPRPSGCPFPIEPEVRLDEGNSPDTDSIRVPTELCVGIDPSDNHHYCIFPSPPRRARAGFRQVVGIPVVVPSWPDFVEAATDCGEVMD